MSSCFYTEEEQLHCEEKLWQEVSNSDWNIIICSWRNWRYKI